MIDITKKGIGDFPEFVGLQLQRIVYPKAADEKPNLQRFEFRQNGAGIDYLYTSVDPFTGAGLDFVGKIVTGAYQQKKTEGFLFAFEFGDRGLFFQYQESQVMIEIVQTN